MADLIPATLESRMTAIEAIQVEHKAQLCRIEANTSDIIATFDAFKGAWTVLNWIGKLAKPLGYIVTLGGGVIYFKEHIKDLFK